MAAATASAGEITAGSMYTLEEVRARMGLGLSALRTARRKGLKVRKVGRRGYILGKDFISYVESADDSALVTD